MFCDYGPCSPFDMLERDVCWPSSLWAKAMSWKLSVGCFRAYHAALHFQIKKRGSGSLSWEQSEPLLSPDLFCFIRFYLLSSLSAGKLLHFDISFSWTGDIKYDMILFVVPRKIHFARTLHCTRWRGADPGSRFERCINADWTDCITAESPCKCGATVKVEMTYAVMRYFCLASFCLIGNCSKHFSPQLFFIYLM